MGRWAAGGGTLGASLLPLPSQRIMSAGRRMSARALGCTRKRTRCYEARIARPSGESVGCRFESIGNEGRSGRRGLCWRERGLDDGGGEKGEIGDGQGDGGGGVSVDGGVVSEVGFWRRWVRRQFLPNEV